MLTNQSADVATQFFDGRPVTRRSGAAAIGIPAATNDAAILEHAHDLDDVAKGLTQSTALFLRCLLAGSHEFRPVFFVLTLDQIGQVAPSRVGCFYPTAIRLAFSQTLDGLPHLYHLVDVIDVALR